MRKLALLVCFVCLATPRALAAGNTLAEAQVKPGAFIWQGLVEGPAPYLALDLNLKITESVFIPLGYGRYNGKLDTQGIEGATDVQLQYQSLTAGIGYLARPSRSVEIPFGVRFGYGKLEFSTDEDSVALSGKSIEPFLGVRWNATQKLALGVESRIIAFLPNGASNDDDDDKDDEDEDKHTVGIPQAHMLTLSYALGDTPRRPAATAKSSRGARAKTARVATTRD